MPHQKSSDYKETAVQYYLVEDKSQEEVCKIFKCSRRSLMRWVDKYKKDGKITGYKRTPKAYKVHKEHVDFLLQEIKKNKTITIEDLLYLLKNKYPNLGGVLNEKRCKHFTIFINLSTYQLINLS
jgi:transposase